MKTQAGKLDQKITLQSLTETNSNGESIQSWTTVADVWGDVISQRGAESFQAARENAAETIRVLIRYRDDVQNTWRLLWGGQYYSILYVDRSQRRQGQLWLTAQVKGAV